MTISDVIIWPVTFQVIDSTMVAGWRGWLPPCFTQYRERETETQTFRREDEKAGRATSLQLTQGIVEDYDRDFCNNTTTTTTT